jgi:hypothetical protein
MKKKQLTLGEKIQNVLEYDSEYRNIKIAAEKIKSSGAEFQVNKGKSDISKNILVNDTELNISFASATG